MGWGAAGPGRLWVVVCGEACKYDRASTDVSGRVGWGVSTYVMEAVLGATQYIDDDGRAGLKIIQKCL